LQGWPEKMIRASRQRALIANYNCQVSASDDPFPRDRGLSHMTDISLEYPYKPNLWKTLAAIAFFGACAGGMGYAAVTNDRGLILNGVITFSPAGAAVFYWCVAAAAALFVLLGLYTLIASSANPGVLRLTATELSVPSRGFSAKPRLVSLADLLQISVQTVSKQRFLIISHRAGKLSVAQSMLPNAEAFEKLQAALAASLNRRSR
jgi:hypothetical protein